MELNIHSGLEGQLGPFVKIKEDRPIGDCRVTRYIFTDYTGAELIVYHFEHGACSAVGDEVVIS